MKALILQSPVPLAARPDPLAIAEVPVPSPGPGQVRLRVQACGICHTDLHIVEGDLPAPALPLIPGHQIVGIIEAVGPGVTGLREGDRVGVAWLYETDGTCPRCREGKENLCVHIRFTGYHVPGGYAEAVVAPAAFVYRLPSRYADAEAAPLLCAGIVGYRSLRLAEIHPGERVGLFGFGASAHLAMQVTMHWGCEVYVFTRSPDHRALARALGAAWTGGIEDEAPGEVDRGVVFAPSAAVVVGALGHLRRGGTLAINAIHLDRNLEVPYEKMYWERTIRSVANATRADAEEFLALAGDLSLHVSVTTAHFDGVNAALGALKRGQVQGAAVLLLSERT
ncbi:MAG TPA: zinc-dependent alcohol dehydrogenase family protein [bacterium]|nr:zinc-dependent alcohol dehydrogenase family protein [bacterium]